MSYDYGFLDRKNKTIAELAVILGEFKRQGKVIMHCHGVYDLLHPGHIHQFIQAKARGDILVITVTKDEHVMKGPGRPYLNESLRLMSVASQEVVDFVAFSEWPTAVECIERLRPNYFVKGEEFINPVVSEDSPIGLEVKAVERVGGQIFFTNMLDIHSSKMLNEFFPVFPQETAEFLKKMKKGYDVNVIAGYLSSLKNLRVLLIGETIVDRYRYIRLIGKSPKGGVVAKHFLSDEFFIGGIMAAANHLANFCDQVEVVSLLGLKESREEFIRNQLSANIKSQFFYHPETHTIVKERDVDSVYFHKYGEMYYYDDKPLSAEVEADIEKYLEQNLSRFDFVLAIDYGHRFFTSKLINLIHEKSKFLALNTQVNAANYGFNVITKWPGANLIVLDERELRLATHNETDDIRDLISELQQYKKDFFKTIAIPRGNLGSTIFSSKEGFKDAPVFSTKVLDTVGAGTAYIAIVAPLIARGVPIELVCFIGNVVGAMNVSVLANKKSTNFGSLMKFIGSLLK